MRASSSNAPVFQGSRFQQLLKSREVGRYFIYFPVTSTTMDLARREAERGARHGTLVLADEQTAGRGRRGRTFYSPPGQNLYFTLVLRLPLERHRALPVAIPLAVCRAIRGERVDARIKWPNDIWVKDRKLCGMLIDAEMAGEGSVAFPGIGINVNDDPTKNPELVDSATSIRRECGYMVSREALLARICDEIERAIEQPIADLTAEYRELSMIVGRPVVVYPTAGASWSGRALDIADTGELLVRGDDGTDHRVTAADVSVRPG